MTDKPAVTPDRPYFARVEYFACREDVEAMLAKGYNTRNAYDHMSEHQRHCGIHKNTNNTHMHIAYLMVHPKRRTRHEPFRDYITRDKLCRELEREYDLTVDNGREQRRESALSQKAAAIEVQTGQEPFESYAKRHKEKIF